MTKVLILSKYTRIGASSRLRTQQYVPFLISEGVDIKINSFFDDKYLNNLYQKRKISKFHLTKLLIRRLFVFLSVYKYDLLWIEKELIPYFPPFLECFLKLLNIKFVVDYDDAIFHNYDQSNNKMVRLFLSNKISKVMKLADKVFVGNYYLYEYAEKSNAKEIHYIPTVVDVTRYKKKDCYKTNVINIGWIGTPSTQKYLLELKEVFIRLQEEFNINIIAVGANNIVTESFSGINHQVLSWSEASEAQLISSFDIGIMPLSNGLWEKGKCGYKLIQYMASAIPVVATPVGVNIDIVNSSTCGYLAGDHEQWYLHLKSLMSDEKLRETFGINGYLSVQDKYSLQVQKNKILKLLQ